MSWNPITADDSSLPPLDLPVWLQCEGIASPFIGCRTIDDGGWYWANCYGDYYRHGTAWVAGTAEIDDFSVLAWQYLPEPFSTAARIETIETQPLTQPRKLSCDKREAEPDNQEGSMPPPWKPFMQRISHGEWTVRVADYDRLRLAALDLTGACKDRLPPGFYDQVSAECRAVRNITEPKP